MRMKYYLCFCAAAIVALAALCTACSEKDKQNVAAAVGVISNSCALTIARTGECTRFIPIGEGVVYRLNVKRLSGAEGELK